MIMIMMDDCGLMVDGDMIGTYVSGDRNRDRKYHTPRDTEWNELSLAETNADKLLTWGRYIGTRTGNNNNPAAQKDKNTGGMGR